MTKDEITQTILSVMSLQDFGWYRHCLNNSVRSLEKTLVYSPLDESIQDAYNLLLAAQARMEDELLRRAELSFGDIHIGTPIRLWFQGGDYLVMTGRVASWHVMQEHIAFRFEHDPEFEDKYAGTCFCIPNPTRYAHRWEVIT